MNEDESQHVEEAKITWFKDHGKIENDKGFGFNIRLLVLENL